MSTSSTAPATAAPPLASTEGWNSYNVKVLTICILGWAFDIYEATIMQLVTPLLIQEWGITPATMGFVTTVVALGRADRDIRISVLADLYGRRPALIWAILGYSIFTGLTGFSTGWISLLIFSSITRIALAGEEPGRHADGHRGPRRPNGAPPRSAVSSAAIRSAICLCSLAALVVRALVGVALALFPRHPAGAAGALDPLRHQGKSALRACHRADAQGRAEEAARYLFAGATIPARDVIASLVYFFYLFTWIGWSAWIAVLSRHEASSASRHGHLSLDLDVLRDIRLLVLRLAVRLYGRRWVIPAFAVPAGILLIVMGYCETPTTLFWVGLAVNFLRHRQLRHRPGLHRRAVPDANPRHRRRRVLYLRPCGRLDRAADHGLDRDQILGRRRSCRCLRCRSSCWRRCSSGSRRTRRARSSPTSSGQKVR